MSAINTVTISLKQYETMCRTIEAVTLKKGVLVYYFPDKIYYAATDNDIAKEAMKEVERYKKIAEDREKQLNTLQAKINQFLR